MTRWEHRTCRQRRTSLIVMSAAAGGALSLFAWSVLHSLGDAVILGALLLTAAAAVSAVWVLIDNWANRYDRAFELGYRLRVEDDDTSPSYVPAQRYLQAVEFPRD